MFCNNKNKRTLLKYFIVSITVFLLIGNLNPNNVDAAKIKLKFSMINNEYSEAMLLAESFRDWIKSRTNGDIEIIIYPGTLTTSAEESFEQLQSGAVDCGLLVTGHAAGFYPDFQFMQLPYLFKSMNHYRVARHSGPILEIMRDFGDKFNLKVLGMVSDCNGLAIGSTKTINKFEDCKGIKIRTPQNPMYVETYQAFGFTVTPTDWGELYTSLQTGRVNADDIGVYCNAIYKLNEVINSYAILNQMWTQTFLVFTEKAWNKLDEKQQDIVTIAAAGACELADEWVYYQEKVYIEQAKKDGITVTYPDTKPFIEASNAIYTKWFKKYPKWKKWYDEIQLFNPETRMPEAFNR